MTLTVTLISLAVAVALFALAYVRAHRPLDPGRPRMIPWFGIQMVCLVFIVVLLAHLVSLLTGTPLVGRQGY